MGDGGGSDAIDSLPRVQLYVAMHGSDDGPGTREQPLRTAFWLNARLIVSEADSR